MNLTKQQSDALQAIQAWLRTDRKVFKLFGFAGTGKTTLAREVENMVKTVVYTAFTGKAVVVLRNKGANPAYTCHSLLYRAALNEFTQKWSFSLNRDSIITQADLVVLDEGSMISDEEARNLLLLAKRVLVLADPAQLPPVSKDGGPGFFMSDPDFLLTEIHRQAADNPIIALSMQIRNGEPLRYGSFGDQVRVIRNRDLTDDMVYNADQIIVGSNQTRHYYNGRVRQLQDRPKHVPVEGDRLIGLRNDKELGYFNGSIWNVLSVDGDAETEFEMNLQGIDVDAEIKTVCLPECFNGQAHTLSWQRKRDFDEFDFAYAITCHKSQGSSYESPIVIDQSAIFKEDAAKWLYTAVTRSSDKLIVVK